MIVSNGVNVVVVVIFRPKLVVIGIVVVVVVVKVVSIVEVEVNIVLLEGFVVKIYNFKAVIDINLIKEHFGRMSIDEGINFILRL